jgi:hypothetical protein
VFKKYLNKLCEPFFFGILILTLLLVISFNLRRHDFNNITGAQNLEATYHVLLTITALNESPIKNHWYLPSVSLGGDSNKHIPWGATVPTRTGDYIYTSFTPSGFLAPYFLFKIFDLETTIQNLAYFNFFLNCISTFILFSLLTQILTFNKHSPWTSVGGALIGCTISIFSREALQSHGIVYWSQSLYQSILIFFLFILFKYFTCKNEKDRKIYAIIAAIMALIGALIEWTGYIFNIGIIIILSLNIRKDLSSKVLAIQIFITSIIAGAITIIHYGFAVGFWPTISALFRSLLARSTLTGSFIGLLDGYKSSYGSFLLTMIVAFIISLFNKSKRTNKLERISWLMFGLACIPLIENLIMLQHAIQFSFDRLKFIFPASIVLSFLFVRLGKIGKIAFLFLILFSSFYGYRDYRSSINSYSHWGAVNLKNINLKQKIQEKTNSECTIFSSNIAVRGYSNLLFHCGIYENTTIQESNQIMAKKNKCASVFLEGAWVFTDLPEYSRAIITYSDNTSSIVDGE